MAGCRFRIPASPRHFHGTSPMNELALPDQIQDDIKEGKILRWTLSKLAVPPDQEDDSGFPEKISGRLIETRQGFVYQKTIRRGKQEFHENLSLLDTVQSLRFSFGMLYLKLNLHSAEADYELRAKPSGEVSVKRRKPSLKHAETLHDHKKNRLLPDNEPLPFLVEAGLMTDYGQLKSSGQAKFRQINRYLEFVRDVLPVLPADRPVRIIDFGCGKSYLTFALHHWLAEVLELRAEIVGLDRDPGVIEHCRHVTSKLNLDRLRFDEGEIAGYEATGEVDLVISLHACDTATDDALVQAVAWNARAIMVVPCCQHEVSRQIESSELQPILRHGILKERFAAMATDSLRALALEAAGYKTQVMEFIDMEHTPKNLLIRAVKTDFPPSRDESLRTYQSQKELLGIGAIRTDRLLDAAHDAA
jgi:SAM-dependent methyltransferase